MGLTCGVVEPWEDGLHTDGSKETYKWWYNGAHFPDGSIMVIIFFSKSPIEVNGPVKPQATLELTLPDGTKYSDQVAATIENGVVVERVTEPSAV